MAKTKYRFILVSAAVLALVILLLAAYFLIRTTASVIKNPGFEIGSADGYPADWHVTGSKDAVTIESGGRSGGRYLLIGVSYYPYWHGSLADLQANLNDLSARYEKDVVVAETAYGFTYAENDRERNILQNAGEGYPMTPEGQAAFLRDLLSVVRAVPGGRGLGIFYWEATWTAVPGNGWDPANPATGNGWENQALFDYGNLALPALKEFLNP